MLFLPPPTITARTQRGNSGKWGKECTNRATPFYLDVKVSLFDNPIASRCIFQDLELPGNMRTDVTSLVSVGAFIGTQNGMGIKRVE